MKIEIAKNVMEHFHKMPFGFPRGPNDDEYKLLEKPIAVTDEEGEVLAQLMPYGEHIDDIAERLGRDKNELIPLLHSLIRKTWVMHEGTKEDGYYRVAPFIPGVYEMQIKHFSVELLDWHQAHMTPQSLLESAFGGPGILPWFRALPHEEAVPYNVEVLPSELLSHIIAQTSEIAVTDCMCRTSAKLRGGACDAPREDICMFFDLWATTGIEAGAARAITKEEALKIARRGRDAGLVHQTMTCAQTVALCNCCSCHCPALRSYVAGLPYTELHSNFQSEIDMELCNGCQSCIKVCPTKAITLDRKNKKALSMVEKCIGCGLCVIACPIENAVTLKRREQVVIYPNTWDDYLRIRAQQTGRTEFYKE